MNAFEITTPQEAYCLLTSAREYIRVVTVSDYTPKQDSANRITGMIWALLDAHEGMVIPAKVGLESLNRWIKYRDDLNWEEPQFPSAEMRRLAAQPEPPHEPTGGSDCRPGGSCGLSGLGEWSTAREKWIRARFWVSRAQKADA
jgi:hypothetical protein